MKKSISAVLLTIVLIISLITPVLAALKGDIDGTPGISASDARLVLRAAVGLEVLTASQLVAADADGDTVVSASDARLILRASVGLENLGEIPEAHVHEYKFKEITREPTCSNSGRQLLVCSCGKETFETIEALGHDFGLSGEEAPTCMKKGKSVFTCSRCSYSKTEYTDKLDHDFQLDEAKPAGCETKGHNLYKCSMCGRIKNEPLEPIGHSYSKTTGLCENCGLSDPTFYEEIPLGEKWIVADNWEISIESVINHPLHSTGINESKGYTDEQCVLITYKVKNIGYKPHLANATGLIITPLDFKVYDETGEQADNYVCNHTKYAQVEINGLTATGVVPVVLRNDSDTITFVISEYDSDGVIRRAFFTANITE